MKQGNWKYIKNKHVRNWARNKERARKDGIETRNKKEGHVYICDLGNGTFKVGCTYSIDKRISAFRTTCPNAKCVWSAWCKDMYGLEQKLHRVFKSKKVKNEVFVLSSGDVMTANNIANQFRE